MISKNTTYVSRLDHLRFFAALLVFVYHWHAWTMIRQHTGGLLFSLVREGEMGVSLFMVLSGFILTRITIGKKVIYRYFILNRIIRIYPMYIFVLIVAAYSGDRAMDMAEFIQYLLPINNLHNMYIPKFEQMWTVAVEFQFYLLFPLLVAFLSKFGIKYIFGLISIMVMARLFIFLADGAVRDAAYWTILGRLDQFCIGMLAAKLYLRRAKVFSFCIALPLSIVAVYVWIYIFEDVTGGGYYGVGSENRIAWIVSPSIDAIVWSALVLAYLSAPWNFPKWTDSALAFLGSISFSMYAWHYPILRLVDRHPHFAPFNSWFQNFALVLLPVVILVSTLSYFVIERPFLGMRVRYLRNSAPSQLDESGEAFRAGQSA
jgi:peptidoglycan/LPS O-acetylase OafA/YrhL